MTAVAVPPRWDGHQLVLATDPLDGAAMAGWAEHGLRRREKMLFAAPDEHTSVEKLVASLSVRGIDASGAAEDGWLEVVEPDRFYTTDGYTSLIDQAHRAGYRGVRTFGGPDIAAAAVSAAEFEEFERVADRMWAALGVTAFCRYDPRVGADRDRLADVVVKTPPDGATRWCTPTASMPASCAWKARSTPRMTRISRRSCQSRPPRRIGCW